MYEVIIGIMIGILGILISIYIHRLNEKSLLSEKVMILDKVSDIKTILQFHINELKADQERRPTENLDTIGIRKEKVEGMIEILSRFEKRLKDKTLNLEDKNKT